MKRLVILMIFSVIFLMTLTYLSLADDLNSGKKLIETPINSGDVRTETDNSQILNYQGFQSHTPGSLPQPLLVVDDPPGNFMPHGDWEFNDGRPGSKPKLMIMWNLVEYLDLDEDAATEFFPIFNKHNEQREELMKQHRELVNDIINKVDNKSVSVKELNAMLDRLDRIEESIDEAHESYLDEAQDVLDD